MDLIKTLIADYNKNKAELSKYNSCGLTMQFDEALSALDYAIKERHPKIRRLLVILDELHAARAFKSYDDSLNPDAEYSEELGLEAQTRRKKYMRLQAKAERICRIKRKRCPKESRDEYESEEVE